MSRLTKEQAADIDYLRAGIMSEYAATGGAFAIERTRAKRIVSMLEAMIDELAQAKSDRDTLAAEVGAWRDGDGKGHDCAMAEPGYVCPICTTAAATDASGALDRAAKETQ